MRERERKIKPDVWMITNNKKIPQVADSTQDIGSSKTFSAAKLRK